MKRKLNLNSFEVESFIKNVSRPEKIKGGNTLAHTNNHLCKPKDTYTGGCYLPN
ncbi:hypothetical protein AB9P05_16840 [Roseivirga sp. BDSF3-8]|uniref:hypothetical protein n=1 Tax=Roseivirga sp. BDSF3-8 TaxID=3241598 RepID=UPI003531918A